MPLWPTIKNEYFTNMKISPTLLRWNTKKSRDRPNGNLCPLVQLFYPQLKNYQNIDNKTKMMFLKIFISSINNCELNQIGLCTLGPTLTCINLNLNKLNPINLLMTTGEVIKTGTLATSGNDQNGIFISEMYLSPNRTRTYSEAVTGGYRMKKEKFITFHSHLMFMSNFYKEKVVTCHSHQK